MSIKDHLEKEQPILYQILSKSFQSGKIPHAFLGGSIASPDAP